MEDPIAEMQLRDFAERSIGHDGGFDRVEGAELVRILRAATGAGLRRFALAGGRLAVRLAMDDRLVELWPPGLLPRGLPYTLLDIAELSADVPGAEARFVEARAIAAAVREALDERQTLLHNQIVDESDDDAERERTHPLQAAYAYARRCFIAAAAVAFALDGNPLEAAAGTAGELAHLGIDPATLVAIARVECTETPEGGARLLRRTLYALRARLAEALAMGSDALDSMLAEVWGKGIADHGFPTPRLGSEDAAPARLIPMRPILELGLDEKSLDFIVHGLELQMRGGFFGHGPLARLRRGTASAGEEPALLRYRDELQRLRDRLAQARDQYSRS